MDWLLNSLNWFAVSCTVVGLYLNGKSLMACWPIWLVGNVFWIAHWTNVWTGGGTFEETSILMNVIFFGLNAKGWWEWQKDPDVFVSITDTLDHLP